ncbi:nonphosphorylating glyceraldehyde-3-phosphate dehydrogenase [Glutamicibacter mysorens]|uniref:Nonphosphorylating glyceraldehyde-3-phosphate dehydrogenase n=1 Tax=Glutamicibacter mysorens TaxID=257984 RepID=A0ABX4MUN3_9MICC|nr:NAD-dependent succinate-semialdehyde dehydrogenase [Glutamicibacter mysorens]PJJ42943.1 nonphosphorylating glyceraldehyde-3-phosphate dehydrogenase [Glutamicibacter mysorens]
MKETDKTLEQDRYRIQNPGTGITTLTYPEATNEQVLETLEQSHEGFLTWRKLSSEARAEALLQAGKLFKERSEELARIATEEMGKGLSEARSEVSLCHGIFKYYGSDGPALVAPTPIDDIEGGQAEVQKLPLGPLLGIMPWNFPYYQVLRFAVPNLIAGNSVIIKPAEPCPASALAVQKIMDEAGIPHGVYNTLLANHEQIETVIADERIQGVSLTGSERAGQAVGMIAAKYLKKIVLELGGSDPYIVLDSDDVKTSAISAWKTRISNMGQSCNSNKRMIVNEDIFDEFVATLVEEAKGLIPGNPMLEENGTYNPLVSENAARGLLEQVRDAVSKGATLHAGGVVDETNGAYFAPAVLTGVVPGMRAYDEELFGPVAVIYSVSNDDEAVTLANDSAYGLGGAVFSTDPERARKVALQLNTGMTHINTAAAFGARLPFGGIKRSGFGRELGPNGMDEFVNKRLVYKAT